MILLKVGCETCCCCVGTFSLECSFISASWVSSDFVTASAAVGLRPILNFNFRTIFTESYSVSREFESDDVEFSKDEHTPERFTCIITLARGCRPFKSSSGGGVNDKVGGVPQKSFERNCFFCGTSVSSRCFLKGGTSESESSLSEGCGVTKPDC